MEQTIKCRICGNPYKVYSHTVADQSACPRCVKQASDMMRQSKPTDYQSGGLRALNEDELKELNLKNAEGMRNAIFLVISKRVSIQ